MNLTRIKRLPGRRGIFLLAALALVVSQTLALEHTHNGDLQLRFDCQLCVKLSSADDAIPVSLVVVELERQNPDYVEPFHAVIVAAQPSPVARAPPAPLEA